MIKMGLAIFLGLAALVVGGAAVVNPVDARGVMPSSRQLPNHSRLSGSAYVFVADVGPFNTSNQGHVAAFSQSGTQLWSSGGITPRSMWVDSSTNLWVGLSQPAWVDLYPTPGSNPVTGIPEINETRYGNPTSVASCGGYTYVGLVTEQQSVEVVQLQAWQAPYSAPVRTVNLASGGNYRPMV